MNPGQPGPRITLNVPLHHPAVAPHRLPDRDLFRTVKPP